MSHNKGQPNYVSNDSSLGSDAFYDAVEDFGKQRVSSVGGASSVSYGSTSRARSSSAGTLVPTPAAAELMAALASADSSKNVDLSEFATAGEYETPGSVAMDEGEPGGSLGLDGFYRERSTNPFASTWGAAADNRDSNAAGGVPGGYFYRTWSQTGHQQPSRMVITDISSSETTPVHTPVAGVDDVASSRQIASCDGVSSTLPWQARSPTPSPPPRFPPRLPLRMNQDTAVPTTASVRTGSVSNPFAGETATTARGTDTSTASSNPFVTANTGMSERSPVNPFDETYPTKANCKEEERHVAPPSNGGNPEAIEIATRPVASAALIPSKVKSKPPPLPPRRPTNSHRNSDTQTKNVEGSSNPSCSQSIASSAPTIDTVEKVCDEDLRTLEVDPTELSATNDSNGGTPGEKYMVINKDTGEQFDVRELEQHMPAINYTLLPSRRDLMELECRRSIEMSADAPEDSRSEYAPPRSSLPSTLVASMAAAVGTASSRKERAKTLGTIMRRRLGQVAAVAGAAATGNGRNSAPHTTSVDGGRDQTRPSPGGAGDRGSGGMGAAARVVSGALSGIRGSLKGKESSGSLSELMLFQELQCHQGPIWAAEFNQSGQFLATAGQDARILLHRVGDLRKELGEDDSVGKSDNPGVDPSPASGPVAAGEKFNIDDERGEKFDEGCLEEKRGPEQNGRVLTGSDYCVSGELGENKGLGNTQGETVAPCESTDTERTAGSGDAGVRKSETRASGSAAVAAVIDTTPWQILEAHKKDIVALAWSRNDFLLSASLDKTVRLWHTTQGYCLHFFKHNDIVTSVDFHPLFEHFFLSGCFDKKIRVWNIRDGRVQEWQQAPDMVTAAKFSLDGKMIVVGLIKGQVLFYQTEGMRYFTQIECRNRRGMKKRGRKVSGFAFKRTAVGTAAASTNVEDSNGLGGGGSTGEARSPMPHDVDHAWIPTPRGGGQGGGRGPGEHVPEQLLVTTNDSRLRLYNTDDFGMNAKFKGFTNDTLQLTATFSEDGKRIICGSENGKVFIWSTGIFASPSSSSLHGTPSPTSAAAQQASTPPSVAPTQKETQRCDESFQATFDPPKIVTTACFVPESTSRACVTAVRGRISKEIAEAGGYCGCMILATDYNGVLRVYCKPAVLIG